MSSAHEPGDWVLVWGQVVEDNIHPEDVAVEFFSHNADFTAHVRVDRVQEAPAPGFARRCPSLYEDKKGRLLRCTKSEGHWKAHARESQMWNNLGAAGRIEDDA